MNCIIIEDQAPAQRVLKKFIQDIGTLTLLETFTDALQALSFLKNNQVDLIFLDIHLPKISGIEFLRSLQNPPTVILTTAFSEYAVQSYEFDVADYLVKPFSFERFVRAVSRISTPAVMPNTVQKVVASAPKERVSFFVKSGYEYIKVHSQEIIFINTDMDYTELHLAQKRHLSSESLQYWEEKLGEQFVRIHKSYLVNMAFIEKVAGNQAYLTNQEILPIGRAYKESFLARVVK